MTERTEKNLGALRALAAYAAEADVSVTEFGSEDNPSYSGYRVIAKRFGLPRIVAELADCIADSDALCVGDIRELLDWMSKEQVALEELEQLVEGDGEESTQEGKVA